MKTSKFPTASLLPEPTPVEFLGRREAIVGTLAMIAAGSVALTGFAGPALARSAAPRRTAPKTATIWLPGVPNGRDIGGIRVADGRRIKTGFMLRTAALAGATASGIAGLQKAKVANVIDLRTASEIKSQPDPQIAGITENYMNVFGDSIGIGVADFSDPKGTAETARATMIQSYRDMVSLDSAHDSYRRFLLLALEGKPFAFHCTEGKDRTGWGAALLLELLSASRKQIRADYLLSNFGLIKQNAGIEKQMKALVPNANMAVLKTYLSVSLPFLDAAYDEANKRFGSFRGYVNKALGFGDKDIAALRSLYLTR